MLRLTLALSREEREPSGGRFRLTPLLRHERPNTENYPEAQCALKPQIT